MTATVYVVLEGGCVQSVHCSDGDTDAYVLDLDDQRDDPDEDVARLLKLVEKTPTIW